MLTLTGLDRIRVAVSPGRKAHLYADGILCGAEPDGATQYQPMDAWYRVRPRERCRRCSLLWEKAKRLLSVAEVG